MPIGSGSSEYLEPTGLTVSWGIALEDDAISSNVDPTYGNYFYLYLTSDDWDGTNTDTEACVAIVDLTTAPTLDKVFTDAGAHMGWDVPAGSSYTTSAGCKLVDPSGTFGSDPAGYFIQHYTWGIGIASDSGK